MSYTQPNANTRNIRISELQRKIKDHQSELLALRKENLRCSLCSQEENIICSDIKTTNWSNEHDFWKEGEDFEKKLILTFQAPSKSTTFYIGIRHANWNDESCDPYTFSFETIISKLEIKDDFKSTNGDCRLDGEWYASPDKGVPDDQFEKLMAKIRDILGENAKEIITCLKMIRENADILELN